MTGRWQKLQKLFAEAAQLDGRQRRTFLDENCAGDNELRRELEALLSADADDTLAPQALFAGPDLDPQLEGSQLGVYRLGHRIGVGGMGSVYLAKRADGVFERQVAVKVVRKGMDSEHVLQRFAAERQILSRLSHPNIAALLDGGVTPDGRPYFVMEYVDGLPITEYCDQRRLTIKRRLELFQAVCRTVHYAHRNLVVHRDLKPSNILVTHEGEVKLLDFGIAKLLDAPEDAALTRTGMPVLTPAYASPEQLMSLPVTTGTDVYALGVILYELLTGRRPYEALRTADEMRRQVLSGDAPRPSTVLTRQLLDSDGKPGLQTLAAVSASRSLPPARLRQSLSGDLDTICLMAIRLEPVERYASAEQFAEDLQRHLAGEPVRAQKASTGYRLKKFVRRHRAGVFATALVVLGISALVAFYTHQLAQERDFAISEQRKVEEVVGFVTGLFVEADPDQSRGEELTARQILDAGRNQIENELAGQPELQATMMRVLAEVYYKLGNAETAEELLRAALDLHARLSDGVSLEAASSLLSLGMIQQDRGDYEQAAAAFQTVLDVRRAELDPVSLPIFEALGAQAFLQETLANYEQAEALHLESFRLAQQLYPEDDVALAQAHSQLAGYYRSQDRRDEAEVLLRDGLVIMQRLYDGHHPLAAKIKRQLAGLLRNSNRPEESEPLFLEAIALQQEMLGPDHHELAVSWNGYSQLLGNMGRHAEALEANHTMIGIIERNSNGSNPNLGAAYNNLAYMLRVEGRMDEALAYFDRALAVQDEVGLPEDHLNRTFPRTGKASVFYRTGRQDEAEAIFREALAIRQPILGDRHRLIAELQSDLAAVLIKQAEFDEAETLLLEAYSFFVETQNKTADRRVEAARRLVALYTEWGRPHLAAPYQEAIDVAMGDSA